MASPSTLNRSLELAGTLPALMVAADRVAATSEAIATLERWPDLRQLTALLA